MRDLNVKLLQQIVGGRLRLATLPPRDGHNAAVRRVVIDSRQVGEGDVFWGLAGSRADGADFAEDAFDRGASGVIVAGRYVRPWPGRWSLQVDDSQRALTQLAEHRRRRFSGQLVAVTGSVGKTTTREMIHAVLRTRLRGTRSPANYNNHVGVPLSMLAIESDHDYAVLELAATAAGEIAALAALCEPQIGVVTCIGAAHLETFGSVPDIARAKAELVEALPSDGWAVMNGDDPWLRAMARHSRAKIVWVGRSLDCDIRATDVHSQGGSLRFRVDGYDLRVPVWGRHHLTGALAAVAVGRIRELSMADIARGLAGFEPPPMRCQVARIGAATVINDAYNASPTAMHAALELLHDMDTAGRRVVVCGDMRELGDQSVPLHRRFGEEVVTRAGADLLLACGDHAHDVVAGAREAGMPPARALACRSPAEAGVQLRETLGEGDVVLVKASRASAMERVVQALELRCVSAAPQAKRPPIVHSEMPALAKAA